MQTQDVEGEQFLGMVAGHGGVALRSHRRETHAGHKDDAGFARLQDGGPKRMTRGFVMACNLGFGKKAGIGFAP